MKVNNVKRFYLLQVLLWAAWASFGQFYTADLVELGYSSEDVGHALSLFTLLSVGGQSFFGLLSDVTKTIKKVYLFIIGLGMGLVVAFSMFTENKAIVFLVIAALGFVWMPKNSMLDSWIMGTDGIDHQDYGKFRWWGSFGYAIVALVFGNLIGLYGWNVMAVAFVGISVIEMIVVMSTDDINVTHDSQEKVNISQLLSNKFYMLLIIFAVLIGTGKFMIINFYPFVFKAVGGNEVHMGIAASVAAFVEIPMFFISGKIIKKFKPIRILLVCSIMYFLRIILTWMAVNPTQIILIAVIQAIGFSYIMATGRVLVARITPSSIRTTAQGIFSAAFFSVSGVIASLVGGYLIDNKGMNAFYFVGSLFIFAGVLLMLIINIWSNVKTKLTLRPAVSTVKVK
jgi:PPP family 3-phenylpropionic acid transporter